MLVAACAVLGACALAGADPAGPTATAATGTATASPAVDSPSPAPDPSAATFLASPSGEPAPSDPLLARELIDVRSGEGFTLGELAAEKPVLLETMAIWCTTCLAQQREVVTAHELADFHSVGIDVDPNERAEDLAAYAQREGFDWRFAMADPELVAILTERYGFGVTNPPSTPTFVITADGVRALEFGHVRPAEELVAELAAE